MQQDLRHAVVRRHRENFLRWFPWRRAVITFVAGFSVLCAIRVPIIEQSLLGQPDREMRDTAFKLRTDVYVGDGDPVLLLDIDDDTVTDRAYQPEPPGHEPTASTSRRLIAELLDYARSAPAGRGARSVILDVDIGAPSPVASDVPLLHAALARWAADPNAPTLIIAREAFEPKLLGRSGDVPSLPSTDYDDVVRAAPNMFWSTTRMLADKEGLLRELLPFQCVEQDGRIVPLFSAAILAYAVQGGGKLPDGSPVKRWIDQAPARCGAHPPDQIKHGEFINYHMTMEEGRGPSTRPVRVSWDGYKACGGAADGTVIRQVSAGVVAQAGAGASSEILCRKLVIIGGTNSLAHDLEHTPLEAMPGPIILANATRGLEASHGGVRPLGLPIQAAALAVMSLAMTFGFAVSRDVRKHYHHQRSQALELRRKLLLLPLHPGLLNFILAFAAHFLGVGLFILSLALGFWGFLSGPVFGAAIAEAIQGITDEKD